MKNIGILLLIAAIAFSCNSESKKQTDEVKQEINMENLVKVTIPVHGMTCEGCENAVKKSISSLSGIAEVSASHTDSIAIVKYDKGQVTQSDIEGKIKEAGYTVAN